MTEMQLTMLAGAKLLIAALIGFLYSLAGRGGTGIKRRLHLPILLCLCLLVSGALRGVLSLIGVGSMVLTIPLAYVIYSVFSYGESSWLRKLVGKLWQQIIVGGMHGLSLAILPCIAYQRWGILFMSIVLPALALGTFGDLADKDMPAAYKEAATGTAEFLFPLFIL